VTRRVLCRNDIDADLLLVEPRALDGRQLGVRPEDPLPVVASVALDLRRIDLEEAVLLDEVAAEGLAHDELLRALGLGCAGTVEVLLAEGRDDLRSPALVGGPLDEVAADDVPAALDPDLLHAELLVDLLVPAGPGEDLIAHLVVAAQLGRDHVLDLELVPEEADDLLGDHAPVADEDEAADAEAGREVLEHRPHRRDVWRVPGEDAVDDRPAVERAHEPDQDEAPVRRVRSLVAAARRETLRAEALEPRRRRVVEDGGGVDPARVDERPVERELDLGLDLRQPCERLVEVVGVERLPRREVDVAEQPVDRPVLAPRRREPVRDHREDRALEVKVEPALAREAPEEAVETECPPRALDRHEIAVAARLAEHDVARRRLDADRRRRWLRRRLHAREPQEEPTHLLLLRRREMVDPPEPRQHLVCRLPVHPDRVYQTSVLVHLVPAPYPRHLLVHGPLRSLSEPEFAANSEPADAHQIRIESHQMRITATHPTRLPLRSRT